MSRCADQRAGLPFAQVLLVTVCDDRGSGCVLGAVTGFLCHRGEALVPRHLFQHQTARSCEGGF